MPSTGSRVGARVAKQAATAPLHARPRSAEDRLYLRSVGPAVSTKRRIARSRASVIYLLTAASVALALGGRIAVESLAMQQSRLSQQIYSASTTQAELELSVGKLSSPQRIVEYASTRLGLAFPAYLEVVPKTLNNPVPLPQSPPTSVSVPLPAGANVR